MEKNNVRQIIAFQGLRGLGILLVVVSHCSYIKNEYGNNVLGWAGAEGVLLFILLSGYLAVYNRDAQKQGTASKVWKKIKKFYPLHIFTLLLSLPLSIRMFFGNEIGESLEKLFVNICLLQAWIPKSDFYFSFNYVSWYLSLAVFFSILTPIMIGVIKRLSHIQICGVFILVLACQFLLAYMVTNWEWEQAHWLCYIFPVIRSMEFFVGGGICVLTRERTHISGRRVDLLLLASLAVCFLLLVNSMDKNSEYYSTAYWMAPVCFLFTVVCVGEKDSKLVCLLFQNKFLVFIGEISFELFLTHQLCIRYMREIFRRFGDENNPLLYMSAVLIAVVFSYCLKKFSRIQKNRK